MFLPECQAGRHHPKAAEHQQNQYHALIIKTQA